ncbi:hypothetical protein QUF90_08910 [Desulfococcaceae bacterium HSG9]|nr:hypothetical protein [Desulfococcaceae bacterium HSG9]
MEPPGDTPEKPVIPDEMPATVDQKKAAPEETATQLAEPLQSTPDTPAIPDKTPAVDQKKATPEKPVVEPKPVEKIPVIEPENVGSPEKSEVESKTSPILIEEPAIEPQTAFVQKESSEEEIQEGDTNVKSTLAESTIRVNVGLLDRLMNMVGELVLARNQIVQLISVEENSAFTAPAQHLNLITAELQEMVMKTRMQPIRTIWNQFPRMVRDLAVEKGKQITLNMDGEDTELDRSVMEEIKDPLVHLLRNCVDHGIETPEKRKASGKFPTGRIFLKAIHEGGQVDIEVSDDGAGINPEVLKQKAAPDAA